MLRLSDIDEVTVEPTTDTTLRAYSHSMLNAIATCPTYGLVTYVANKTMRTSSRAMALEAGSAAHECYAAARLWQIKAHQDLHDHAAYHGARLFGVDRYESMVRAGVEAGDDRRNAMLRFCLEAFYTSGFYDDPSDKRRTWTNIEEALIAYLDRFDFRRNVWIADVDDPEAQIGIEIPLDVTITFKWRNGEQSIRFIGTADGVTEDKDGNIRLEENKTASRLGEAWAMAFHTSHQQTGYMLALQTMLGRPVTRAAVHGMCIPLPRSYDAGGLMIETVSRTDQQFSDFLNWMLYNVQVIDEYGSDPLTAPQHTGACNKYFRACSLVPLCASDMETRREFFDMMEQRELSPTEEAIEGEATVPDDRSIDFPDDDGNGGGIARAG